MISAEWGGGFTGFTLILTEEGRLRGFGIVKGDDGVKKYLRMQVSAKRLSPVCVNAAGKVVSNSSNKIHQT